MSKKINLAFMGTPAFAVPSLRTLLADDAYHVKTVYTQPDKPVGRKKILTAPPVKVLALEHQLPVKQPHKVRKNQEVIEYLQSLELDFIVVVAYGKILPKNLLEIPRLGCINVHGSLLEKYRGAAPIQWALANGEKITGVTTMLLDEGMDTGDMLLKESMEIREDDTTMSLAERMAGIGAALLDKTLKMMIMNEIEPQAQNHEQATYAPMIKKEDGQIDWNLTARQIYNRIRAFNPWPSTYTFYQQKPFKIKSVEITDVQSAREPGEVTAINKDGILVATGENCLLLKIVQLAGSKEMSALDFARGHQLQAGFRFEISN